MSLDQPSVQQENLPCSLKNYNRSISLWLCIAECLPSGSCISVSSIPTCDSLLDIHKTLCRLEFELYPQLLDECITNLTQRLRETDHLALDLSLPLWAGNALAQLETAIQEKQS